MELDANPKVYKLVADPTATDPARLFEQRQAAGLLAAIVRAAGVSTDDLEALLDRAQAATSWEELKELDGEAIAALRLAARSMPPSEVDAWLTNPYTMPQQPRL